MLTRATLVATFIFALACAVAPSACGGGSSGGSASTPSGPPGTLDTTFGSGGKVVTPIGADAFASAVVVQPDGKIVAAGSASDTGIALVRWNPDGSLDTAFGSNGVVRAALGGGGGVALQPDGKIVVPGEVRDVNGDLACAVARYTGDGTLDAGFAAGGVIIAPPNASGGCVFAVALQPDGGIVTASDSGGCFQGGCNKFIVLRFRPDGTPDSSFGTGGQTVVAVGPGPTVRAIAVDPDGRIIIGGDMKLGTFGGIPVPFVARVDSKGMLDPAFGQAGLVDGRVELLSDPSSILLQPDGKILIGGTLRLLASGASDPSFVYTFTDENDDINGAALQRDGKVVLALSKWDPTTQLFFFALQRVGPDGRTDMSFGNSGLATAPFGPYSFANAVALQSDGRIVAVGATQVSVGQYTRNLAVAVARFFGN